MKPIELNLESFNPTDSLQLITVNEDKHVIVRVLMPKFSRKKLADVMQIADLCHLHYNLLAAIKKALNHSVPAFIKISHNLPEAPPESEVKKRLTPLHLTNSSLILNAIT